MKLDRDAMGMSLVVERIMKVPIKDCFCSNDTAYCIVPAALVGKAVGKGGITIKKVQEKIGKKVRVVPYSEHLQEFIKNFISPLTVQEIVLEDGVVYLRDPYRKTKSLLIGREGRNLTLLNRAVKRFFPVNEVKVE